MPLLTTPTTTLEYLDQGTPADPTLLLLHGFPDIPATWDLVLELIPPDVRVVRPFLRGVGRSRATDPSAESGQVAALAHDVLDIVDGLGLASVVLVGHDWGARAAHAAAALRPDAFTHLITMSTAYGPGNDLSPAQKLDDIAVAWYRWWLCSERGRTSYLADPDTLTRWAWENWSPTLAMSASDLDEILAATHTDQFAATVAHYYRHGAGEDEGRPRYDDTQRRLDEWPPIPVPSTFLIGTADGCETLAPARTNADFFPAGRTLVELDGVGHFIQRERPDVVAQHILRALGRPQPGIESRP